LKEEEEQKNIFHCRLATLRQNPVLDKNEEKKNKNNKN